MKKQIALIGLCMVFMAACAQNKKDHLVIIHTSFGDMKVLLYDETPLHKQNFIQLVEEGQYDSTIFHRVIKDFMIQGGDIDAKNGERTQKTIPAEISKGFYHEKGALAAARQGDQVNPDRASSWSQFYLVQGKTYTEEEIETFIDGKNQNKKGKLFNEYFKRPENKEILDNARQLQKEGNQAAVDSVIAIVMEKVEANFTADSLTVSQREIYTTIGGTPHLDNEYTVFGKIVEGINLVDSIATITTGRGDKPTEDEFMTMELEKMSKKKITKLYGYEYPAEDEK